MARELKGQLIGEGDTVTLVSERIRHHALEIVWDAIATPGGLEEWPLRTHAEADGRVGGRIESDAVEGNAQDWGKTMRQMLKEIENAQRSSAATGCQP